MTFTLTIKTDGAAFDNDGDGDLHAEVHNILMEAANKILDGATSVALVDINGNLVGRAEFTK